MGIRIGLGVDVRIRSQSCLDNVLEVLGSVSPLFFGNGHGNAEQWTPKRLTGTCFITWSLISPVGKHRICASYRRHAFCGPPNPRDTINVRIGVDDFLPIDQFRWSGIFQVEEEELVLQNLRTGWTVRPQLALEKCSEMWRDFDVSLHSCAKSHNSVISKSYWTMNTWLESG